MGQGGGGQGAGVWGQCRAGSDCTKAPALKVFLDLSFKTWHYHPCIQCLHAQTRSRAPVCLPLPPQDRLGAAEHHAAASGSRNPQEFLSSVVLPMMAMEGDKLPVRWVHRVLSQRLTPVGRANSKHAKQSARLHKPHWAAGIALGCCALAGAATHVHTGEGRVLSPHKGGPRLASAPIVCAAPALLCSVFTPGGFFPPGTAAVEKRGIAMQVIGWACLPIPLARTLRLCPVNLPH